MSLRLSKPWPNKRSNRLSVTYRIKWEALEGKEVRKQFASSISSKFRQLPDVSEDIEREWLLFRSAIISSAAESCGRKPLRMAGDSEKRTRWWNQEVKEAIRAKKDAVGIRLTPSFVITFFLGNSFFSMTQRKTISLSLSAANVAG